jgi:EmrB/QacA subfamily drug resistance transporter
MATTDEHPLAAPGARQHYGVTFAVLAMGTLSYTLLQSLVLPALPTLQRELHTSESSVAWVLTAYLLSASIATPILGRLGDMYGKEKMLLVVLGGIMAGSVIGALASSMPVMIVARIVQGTGGATFPLAFGIVRDEFPPDRVPWGIGLISTIIGVGGGLGIVLGGPIIEHLSFRWLFWIPLVLTSFSLVAAWRFVPESPVRAPGRVNYGTALLLSGWLSTLLVGVSEGSLWGWTSLRVVGLLVVAAALFVIWVRAELASDHPLIDMTMMRIPTVWWTNLSALLFGVGMYSIIVLIPPFLQSASSNGYGFGLSPAISGLFLAPNAGAMLFTGFAIGNLTARFGSKALLLVGALLGGVSFVALTVANGHPWQFLVVISVSGLGIGLGFAAMSNLVVDAVDETQTGAATGMNANIRTIGGAIGSAVVASVLTSGAHGGIPLHRSYTLSFGILALAFFLAAGAAAAVPATGRSSGTEPGRSSRTEPGRSSGTEPLVVGWAEP